MSLSFIYFLLQWRIIEDFYEIRKQTDFGFIILKNFYKTVDIVLYI
jgi:hypothetical protein